MGHGLSGAQWQVIAASVQGVSHKRHEMPCQDAHAWRILPDGALAAAVADGAGSATHAEIGAVCAAQAAVAALADRYGMLGPVGDATAIRPLLMGALVAAREAVEVAAETHGVTPRDLATTLIVVLATRDWIAVAQVGDGATVAADYAGTLSALTTPPDAEYANETNFLISLDALATAQFTLRREPAAQVALFSDGLQRLALRMPEGTPHGPFFAPLLRFAAGADDDEVACEQLSAFLTSSRITDRADDDLTLLLATFKTGE
jgi:hypothetical protein